MNGKPADFVGNPNLPHSYSYVPDIAAGLAILGTDERAIGGTWHLPGPETVSTKALLELVASELGHPVGVRALPKLAVRALGIFNPTIRELVELTYEFDAPFVLDTTKFESTFGTAGTPLTDAIRATLAWYQQRESNLPATRTRSAPAELASTQTNGREAVAKRFGGGRITGLALIALLTLALGYLHFAGGSTALSVPSGAHAGQLTTLKNCTYNTEKGPYAADCGTLVVPENRADPHSRLIALPVIVIRAHIGTPGRPDLPPARRPRHHQHGVPRRQPLHRPPRRRARRLPRRRRLDPARLPGGELGNGALGGPHQPADVPRRRRGIPVVRRPAPQRGCRSRRLFDPRRSRRPRGGAPRPRPTIRSTW